MVGIRNFEGNTDPNAIKEKLTELVEALGGDVGPGQKNDEFGVASISYNHGGDKLIHLYVTDTGKGDEVPMAFYEALNAGRVPISLKDGERGNMRGGFLRASDVSIDPNFPDLEERLDAAIQHARTSQAIGQALEAAEVIDAAMRTIHENSASADIEPAPVTERLPQGFKPGGKYGGRG